MTREILAQLQRLIRPVQVRVANMVARAVVNVIDDETKMQLLQIGVHEGVDLDDAERFQQYGFTGVPHPGAEAVIVFPNGDYGHPLVVAVDDRRYRPTGWAKGEVGMYTDEGDQIRFKRGRVIVVTIGTEMKLGGDGADDPVALKSDLQTLYDAINNAVPVAQDGGLQLQAQILSALNTAGFPVCSQKVKAE